MRDTDKRRDKARIAAQGKTTINRRDLMGLSLLGASALPILSIGSAMSAGAAPAEAGAVKTGPTVKSARIPDDVVVIDAVGHSYNLSEPNIRNRYGASLANLIYGVHATWNQPEHVMAPDVFMGDTPIEILADTVFRESQTDIVVHHQLRLDSWFADGLVAEAKNLEAARRWPDRFITYVGVDPTQDFPRYIEEFKALKERLPSAIGLKLYPHQMDPYRFWRADDPKIMKLFEAAQLAGIKTIAIHKALPNGNVPMAPYKVDDIDLAADAFPDLKFEIVHSGMAFLEETAWLIARYPNVYANLEVTSSLLYKAPGWFEEILAFLMFWGGPQKILWATGAILAHPQPLLERFWSFRFSKPILHKYGLAQITKKDKRMILGGSYAAMVGLDAAAMKAKIAGDEFAAARKTRGLDSPFSNWKKRTQKP